MSTDEKTLVLNLKNGDEKSFNILYNTYYPTLISFSVKYLKSHADAEEIVQNLFLKIWERRNDINEDFSFKSYLFQIAVNDIYNKFKKRLHEKKYHDYIKETSGDPEYLAVADNRFDFQDILDLVRKLIDRFPPQRRLIFTLKKIDGFSNAEIAEKLNISIRSIENQVFRGVKSLRSELSFCFE